MITVNKQLLSGTPADVRATVEDLAGDQDRLDGQVAASAVRLTYPFGHISSIFVLL